jgi:hypothetical protein
MVLDDNNILQADTTVIAGFLVLLTILFAFATVKGKNKLGVLIAKKRG